MGLIWFAGWLIENDLRPVLERIAEAGRHRTDPQRQYVRRGWHWARDTWARHFRPTPRALPHGMRELEERAMRGLPEPQDTPQDSDGADRADGDAEFHHLREGQWSDDTSQFGLSIVEAKP
jgi:hypothetical protein